MQNKKIKDLLLQAKTSAQKGNIEQEKFFILEILNYSPDEYFFIERLGEIEFELERFDEAEKAFEAAIKKNKTPQLAYKLGIIKTQLGKPAEAINCYREVIYLNKDFYQAYYNLGVVLLDSFFYEEAILSFTKFLEYHPDYPDAYLNLGTCHQILKQFDQALAAYHRAIEIKPDFAEVFNNQGNIYSELEMNQEAILSYQNAINIRSNYSEPYNGIAVLYHEMNEMKEAVKFYKKAIGINQNYFEAYNNLGVCYYELKEHSNALDCFESVLKIDPSSPDALYNKSLLKLSLGEYNEGFRLYESRSKSKVLGKLLHEFIEPLWLGEEPLTDKVIYIHSEQGFGDIIQFSRYIKMLNREGCDRIIFDVPQELYSLMKDSFEGNIDVVSGRNKNLYFDFQCPLMSLPLAFKTEVGTIPNFTYYLKPKTSLINSWRRKLRITNKKRVGIAWSGGFRGSDPLTRLIFRRKSIPLAMLTNFFKANVDFYSLQKGDQAESELKNIKSNQIEFDIIDHSSEFQCFSETAALIENLDLVITVCTSIAHLSGALGKPTWLMIPYENCWRWFDDGRADSPWYPSIRLFRQSKSNDWKSVINEVCAELEKEFKNSNLD